MRIRALFTSTALHAGIVCGMGLWLGSSLGDRRPMPAQVRISPDWSPRDRFTESNDRDVEPIQLEPRASTPVLDEPEVVVEPDFEPCDVPPVHRGSLARARDALATPHSREILDRVLPGPTPTDAETDVAEIPPATAVAATPPEVPSSPPAPAAWVDAVAVDDHNLPPSYPELSVRMRETGIVDVLVTIDADGRVTDVELARASRYPRLNRAALDAVRRWQFAPAERVGRRVASSQVVGFEFSLSDSGRGAVGRSGSLR